MSLYMQLSGASIIPKPIAKIQKGILKEEQAKDVLLEASQK